MANRVTGSEVKAIINTSLTDAQVEPFITSANVVVTGRCSSYYTDAEMKEIEKWLSAHLVSIRDPSRSAVIEQDADGPSQKYQLTSKSPVGLATTPYGQQVLVMDYQGKLADLGATSRTSSITSVGPTNEDFD